MKIENQNSMPVPNPPKDFVAQIKLLLPEFTGSVDFNVGLSKFSYFQIGGPAQVLVTPKSLHDLELVNRVLIETKCPLFVLGWGSNLLFADGGFQGIVVRMKFLNTEISCLESGILQVGASLGGSSLLKTAQTLGYSGLSGLTGIPGSVGGMIAMNAGTAAGEMKDLCLSVRYVEMGEAFSIQEHTVGMESFSYRMNHFLPPQAIVTDAKLRFSPEDPKKVREEIELLYQKRKQTQPVQYPSCGSVFINPKSSGLSAWQVVDRLGLRGHSVGGAQISEMHSNYIINRGGAKAADVKALITLIQKRASRELGIEMVKEVKFVGSDPNP